MNIILLLMLFIASCAVSFILGYAVCVMIKHFYFNEKINPDQPKQKPEPYLVIDGFEF